MAQLVVRKIEDEVLAKLRERAARRRVSMEEEHRRILREAVLGTRARRCDASSRSAMSGYLVDTNVVSQLRKRDRANAGVLLPLDAGRCLPTF